MDFGYIDFRVDVGTWKDAHKVSVGDDFSSLKDALLIARATQGVDGIVQECLRSITDLHALDAMVQEARGEKNPGAAFAVLASRKFGKVLAQLTEKPGLQAKEKKEIQELLRLYATRTLARHYGMELAYAAPLASGKSSGLKEGVIQFIANYPSWKCVKKFRVETTTNRRTVAEFLTSYTITLDLRMETYIRALADMRALDALLTKSPKKGVPVQQVIAFATSAELKDAVAAASKKDPALSTALHAYALRKILKEHGMFVDYLQVKSLPGWKRVVGKRK